MKEIDYSKGEIGYGKCATCGVQNNACDCPLEVKGNIGITQVKCNALYTAEFTKSTWKETYTLRARIGIRFAQLLGLIEIKLK